LKKKKKKATHTDVFFATHAAKPPSVIFCRHGFSDTRMAESHSSAVSSAFATFFTFPLAECSAVSVDASVSNALVGFGLVVVASVGICTALNLQKLVHLRSYDRETGLQRVHFTRVPLWWAAVFGNALSELVNLAALGYAPATLVAPLGCLCVVFNSLTAVFCLGEPFFKRDLVGLALISAGVGFIVSSQVRVTYESLQAACVGCGSSGSNPGSDPGIAL